MLYFVLGINILNGVGTAQGIDVVNLPWMGMPCIWPRLRFYLFQLSLLTHHCSSPSGNEVFLRKELMATFTKGKVIEFLLTDFPPLTINASL